MTSTIERLATGEELRAIADPVERLTAAADVAERALELATQHRARRNAAAVQMFREGDVSAVEVWDRTIGVSRSLWTRILNDPEQPVGDFAYPRETAETEAKLTREYAQLAEEAQRVRNETARRLMSREFGKPMRNAEVARLARLTTARVAQLRGERKFVGAAN